MESSKNQPVVQRNEVEVGDLDRRPQLEDGGETHEPFIRHDGWSLKWNSKNSHSSLRWERQCSPARGEKRGKKKQDVKKNVFFSFVAAPNFKQNSKQNFQPVRQFPPSGNSWPSHPLSEGWWWVQAPVGEKSVQKVCFFIALNEWKTVNELWMKWYPTLCV